MAAAVTPAAPYWRREDFDMGRASAPALGARSEPAGSLLSRVLRLRSGWSEPPPRRGVDGERMTTAAAPFRSFGSVGDDAVAPRARRSRVAAIAAARPELLALLVLAAVLDLWSLGTNGMANDYYSAAVRSMSESWHAFLYGS